MRPNVRPLTHWVIYRGYKIRFTARAPDRVSGVLKTPGGEVAFHYDPAQMIVHLPGAQIAINEHGWELDAQ